MMRRLQNLRRTEPLAPMLRKADCGEHGLRSIDDLLTDDEKAELHADLARIHKTTHPEWDWR